jgi:3-oxoacyl-[acyl-carrier protein] reductase
MNTSQTYLFCGASSKIAETLANQLIQEGNKVIGISTKDLSGANYTQAHKVDGYQLTQLPTLDGKINGIVYFPGTINLKPFARITENDFLNDYHINTLGAVNCLQKYLPNLKDSEGASIVLMSTVAVNIGMPFHSSIAMAKGAIEGLTRSLAAELAPTIRVNAVAPSLTNTPLGERFINTPEKLEASEKRNPLKKLDRHKTLQMQFIFYLSNKSSWVTGQILHVDGGMNSLKLL